MYGNLGVSVPDHQLAQIAGTGPSFGFNYERKLGVRFKARASTCFTHFGDVSYPSSSPTPSTVYKMSTLPVQVGLKFYPFMKNFWAKIFISGQLGGQFTFYKSNSYGIQESIYYSSQALDFSYMPSIGLDLNGVCFEYEKQFVVNPHGNQLVQRVSYSNFRFSVKIFRKYFDTNK